MNIKKYNKSVLSIITGTFFSNIGNGMFSIAVSKLLYDKTGSVMSFGYVIILENCLSFIMQFISGYVSDIKNPKKIILISDLTRGIILIIVGILLFKTNSIILIGLSLFLINLIKPFYKSSNFKLISIIERGDIKLIQLNSLIGVLFQIGQFIGMASLIVILNIFSSKIVFVINGISFIISGFLITNVKLKIKLKEEIFDFSNVIKNWKLFVEVLYRNKNSLNHIFVSTGDYMSINFINLMLVPMVMTFYKNTALISVYDSLFAIGAIFSIFVLRKLIKKFSLSEICWLGSAIQGVCFILFISSKEVIFIGLLMLNIGIWNGVSVSIIQTTLQSRFEENMKAKAASLKNFFVSIMTLILVPLISRIYDYSLNYGFITSGVLLIIYSILILKIRKESFFKNFIWN